jgi:hypothetical protein
MGHRFEGHPPHRFCRDSHQNGASRFLIRWLKQRKNPAAPANIYKSLRNQALRAKRDQLGLPAPLHPTDPWAVINGLGRHQRHRHRPRHFRRNRQHLSQQRWRFHRRRPISMPHSARCYLESPSCFSFCSALSLIPLRRSSGSVVSEGNSSRAFLAFRRAKSFWPSAR